MSKATLYTFGLSVWAAVPAIAIEELGYPEGAIEIKVIDVLGGQNFDPEFLKINPKGTIPALSAEGKAYTTTAEVTAYLVQHAPKKVKSATAFTERLHEDRYDPNFPLLLARNEDDLKAVSSGFPRLFVQNRQAALEEYSTSPAGEAFQEFYIAKSAANSGIIAIFNDQVPEEVKQGFFQKSAAHWETLASFLLNELPAALPESGFLGGAVPDEDDFHLAAWLARLANVCGGKPNRDGYKALEKETKVPVSAKIANYWVAWSERASWQKVYDAGLR